MSDLTLHDDGSRLTTDVEGHELVIRYGWQDEDVMRVDFVGVPSALGGRGLGHAPAALQDYEAIQIRVEPHRALLVLRLAGERGVAVAARGLLDRENEEVDVPLEGVLVHRVDER